MDLSAHPIVELPYRLSNGAKRRLHIHPSGDLISSAVGMMSRLDFWFLIEQVFMRAAQRSTLLDVGAHIGLYSVVAADFFEHVVACEPHPGNAALLKANVELNGLANVTVAQVALSDRAGEGPLFGEDFNLSVVSLAPTASRTAGPMARALTGDALLRDVLGGAAERPISMIKIDTEGHDARVLHGLARTLVKHRPVLQVEFCPATLQAHGSRVDDLLAPLLPLSYGMNIGLGHVIAPITPDILAALFEAWKGTLAVADLYFFPTG